MLDTRIFVNCDQIASLQCVNVKTYDGGNTADYRVTLRKDGVVKTKMLYGFDRQRGAMELIHEAIELMRPREQGRY